MNTIKKYLGIVWIMMGIISLILLIREAIIRISANPTQSVYLPWMIITIIFIPIVFGFVLFGWYAFKKEYNS